MRGEAEKYAKKVAPHLLEDETVLVAAQVQYKGGAKQLAGMAGGLVGYAIAAKLTGRPDTPTGSIAEQVPTTPHTLWVQTDQRTLFFQTGNLRFGPPLSIIENGYVASVVGFKAKVRYGKLRFAFVDGSSIELDLLFDREVPRINDAATSVFGAPSA